MLLEVKDLKVSYGKIEAIKGISLNVNKGEIVTLVGANGAGKTTLLKTISGILKPSAGVINFEGKDIQSVVNVRILLIVPKNAREKAGRHIKQLVNRLLVQIIRVVRRSQVYLIRQLWMQSRTIMC